MPEYLAPAVYVEETSFRSKSIEGVGTSTAAFVGMTRRGPLSSGTAGVTPPLLTSFSDFERIYGGLDDLTIGTTRMANHVAHAARAFFANGGGRLYVARVPGTGAVAAEAATQSPEPAEAERVRLRARSVGGAALTVRLASEALSTTKRLALKQPAGTMVRLGTEYFIMGTDPVLTTAANLTAWNALADDGAVEVITLRVEVSDASGLLAEYATLGFHPRHPRHAIALLSETPPSAAEALSAPLMIVAGTGVDAFKLRTALLGTATERTITINGGNDGASAPGDPAWSQALDRLLALEDISIVAAPGSSAFADPTPAAVNQLLIGHAETRRAYRIAVLDTPPRLEPDGVRTLKSRIDSKYAALYYPWIRVANPVAGTDPLAQRELDLPPSGFVCGIYARNDIQRGVHKAPANETVTGALGLQREVRFGEQEVLNPLGINCIRTLPNRGIRVWGARTLSSDPEWKYVNVRRYFLYLEASIDRGTQWAVFEPNGERLWANIRSTISDFLYNEWVNGALLGATPKEAFFVRCDRSTMTQNDLDNGRLVCLIGVAALKPAEFVIFRIGQKTADSAD
jgi:phage tail sheath protein FI